MATQERKEELNAKGFIAEVRARCKASHIPEWDEAQFLTELCGAVLWEGLSQLERERVYDELGMRPDQIILTIADGPECREAAAREMDDTFFDRSSAADLIDYEK